METTKKQPIQPPSQVANPSQPATQPNKSADKMATGHKHIGVMLITRTQMFLYIESVAIIVTYPFSTDVARDLDIVNKQLLTEQVKALITKNNLPPANFLVIAGNPTIFARQIINTNPAQKKVEEENFLNFVPFEDLATQHITMGQNNYLVAANKHFYDSLIESLKPLGFSIDLVLPEFLFAKEVNLSHGLTAESANMLIKKMPAFRNDSLLVREVMTETGEVYVPSKMQLQVKGGKTNRLFVMCGVFFMLVGVLIAVILLTQQQNAVPPKPQNIAQPPVQTEFPVTVAATDEAALASPSAIPSLQPAVQGAKAPVILINHSSKNTTQANQLRSKFIQLGYNAVTLQNMELQVATTRIMLSPTLAKETRQVFLAEIQKQFSTVTVQELGQNFYDVIVNLQNI